MSELDELADRLGRRYGFVIDSAHFALAGRCLEHETNGERSSEHVR